MPDKKISQLTTVFQSVFDDVTAINNLGVTKKTPLLNLKYNLFTQFPGLSSATTSTMGATLTGSAKWWGGTLAPNGKIYCTPLNSTDILIIDPVAGTATRSAMGATLTGSDKWAGGVLAPNGKIYGIPWISTDILIINPVDGTATRSNMGNTEAGFIGGNLAPSGKIYGIPYSNTASILQITPELNTSSVNIPIELCMSAYYNKY